MKITAMKLPFSIEEFLNVFGRYNSDVWPIQLLFYIGAAIGLILLLSNAPKKDLVLNLLLGFFWIWMGSVYHILYFWDINPIAVIFGGVFILQGLIFGYFGYLKGRIHYHYDKTVYSLIGTSFVFYSLLFYPISAYVFGHVYPRTPTFGLPCPTTIFTLGILLFSVARLAWYIYIIPLLWTAVGVSAAFSLNVTEDFALGVAGAIALVAFVAKQRRSPVSQLRETKKLLT